MKKIFLIISVIILVVMLAIGCYIFKDDKSKSTNNTIAKNEEYDIENNEETVIENNKEEIEERIIPEEWNDDGIFSEYYEIAYQKLESLTLEEKIGQLFLARVPSYNQIQDIKDYNLGGYILFGQDTKNETKESLKEKIESYQEAANIPMIIAVDEEGGTVVRISSNPNLRSSNFLSPGQLYKQGGLELIEQNTKEMSELLDSLGINTDLAPVADISTNPNDFIYNRSLRTRC